MNEKNEIYLTDLQFSELLNISVQALRNKVSAGADLPKYCKPKGIRSRLWPIREVDKWLQESLTSSMS